MQIKKKAARPAIPSAIAAVLLLLVLLIWAAGCGQGRPQGESPGDDRVSAQERDLSWDEEPVITLYLHEEGATKELGMEEYLLGVVAAEMDPAWPVEALAAQAILARTFTLERIQSMGGVPQRGTDASTDVEEFQAYDESRINDQVLQAVAKTRGQVVLWEGSLIKAWFFADGGGLTAASALEGLAYDKEEAPYIHSVEDPGSAISEEANQSWQVAIPGEEARQRLQAFVGSDPGPVHSAEILEKGPSGRAVKVRIGELVTGGPAMRLAIGSTEVKSALLTELRVEGDQLIIAGKGYGHGVGMSQWGARALAEEGKSGQEIIGYFYKDVTIETLY